MDAHPRACTPMRAPCSRNLERRAIFPGGEVLNVLLSAMTGGAALAMAVPAAKTLGMGTAAARRVLDIIEK